MIFVALVACVYSQDAEEPQQAPGPDPVAVYKELGQKQLKVNKVAAYSGK